MLAPLRERVEALELLRVDADREVHGLGDLLDLELAIGLLVVEVGRVLERVRLHLAVRERRVRHHVIRELDDLDVEALGGRDGLHDLEDLRVRPRRDADADGLRLGGGGKPREGEEGREAEGLERHGQLL